MSTRNGYSETIGMTWGSITADSWNWYVPATNINPYIGGYMPPTPPKESRCRYCDTKSFEGERRYVACGAPL